MSCLTSIKNNDLISLQVTVAKHFIGAKGLDTHPPAAARQASNVESDLYMDSRTLVSMLLHRAASCMADVHALREHSLNLKQKKLRWYRDPSRAKRSEKT